MKRCAHPLRPSVPHVSHQKPQQLGVVLVTVAHAVFVVLPLVFLHHLDDHSEQAQVRQTGGNAWGAQTSLLILCLLFKTSYQTGFVSARLGATCYRTDRVDKRFSQRSHRVPRPTRGAGGKKVTGTNKSIAKTNRSRKVYPVDCTSLKAVSASSSAVACDELNAARSKSGGVHRVKRERIVWNKSRMDHLFQTLQSRGALSRGGPQFDVVVQPTGGHAGKIGMGLQTIHLWLSSVEKMAETTW